MNVLRSVLGVPVFLGLMAAISPSQSAVMQATFSGTMLSGYWSSGGNFGDDFPDATGLAFSLTYIFDTATPGADRDTVPGVVDSIEGEVFSGIPDPVMSAVFTIGGHSMTLGARYITMVLAGSNGSFGEYAIYSAGQDGHPETPTSPGSNDGAYVEMYLGSADHHALFPASIETAFSIAVTEGYVQGSHVTIFGCRRIVNGACEQGQLYGVEGSAAITHLTVTHVPVPPALVLLLSVLGGLGIVGRLRKARAA